MPKPGNTTERGYGHRHQKLRRQWRERIDAGEVVICWRCAEAGRPHQIKPGEAFDLGHVDGDRSRYRGPECPAGNRATQGRKVKRLAL